MKLHSYDISAKYRTSVAYFSMEFGIDQALKIYSGGLGFLAGSHMRSAYDLKQNLVGIGILWSYGYYDQGRNTDRSLKVEFTRKFYYFLEELPFRVTVDVHGQPVQIKAFLLPPEVFGTAPLILLSTDIDENDYLARTITHKLYDANERTRVSQEIILGIGGVKVLEALGRQVDVYHMNEGHSLPLVFELYRRYGSMEAVRPKVVFTTHTPEKAGNEEHNIHFLDEMGFFAGLHTEEVRTLVPCNGEMFSLTVGALCLAKISNGVSDIHANVANSMWAQVPGHSKIIPITNAQNKRYWTDKTLYRALDEHEDYELIARKKHLKQMLFKVVADQTGKMFDPEVLTIVWARRFAEYKRPWLLKYDLERFENLLKSSKYPVQVIWAGKPYPLDQGAIAAFNDLVHVSHHYKSMAVLIGYELELSRLLKLGSDIWLNTPRLTREASGTSGMTASMNGSIHLSMSDGWHPEFARHGRNSFTIPPCDPALSVEEQDRHDNKALLDLLEGTVLPMYYEEPKAWVQVMKNAMTEVETEYDSGRMVHEYYTQMYDLPYEGTEVTP